VLGTTVLGVFIGRRIRAHVETLREPFGVVQAALLGLVDDIADTSESQEVIVGLSAESRSRSTTWPTKPSRPAPSR
jgi:hypothetical protein